MSIIHNLNNKKLYSSAEGHKVVKWRSTLYLKLKWLNFIKLSFFGIKIQYYEKLLKYFGLLGKTIQYFVKLSHRNYKENI